MAEVPETTAYALWYTAGSWAGALCLLGFKPFANGLHYGKAKKYALLNASARLLPAEMRGALPSECLSYVEQLCGHVRRKGKALNEPDIPKDCRNLFAEAGFDIGEVMLEAGVEIVTAKEIERKRAVQAWKDSTAHWRNSAEYLAMGNRSHEENQRIKRERRQKKKQALAQAQAQGAAGT